MSGPVPRLITPQKSLDINTILFPFTGNKTEA